MDNLIRIERKQYSHDLQDTWIPIDYPKGFTNVLLMACYYKQAEQHAIFTVNQNATKFSFKNTNGSEVGFIEIIFYFFN